MAKRKRTGTATRRGRPHARVPRRKRAAKPRRSTARSRKAKSRARAPITETKQKVIENVVMASATPLKFPYVGTSTMALPVDTNLYIPPTWETMKRGFNADEMTGRDLFLKWITVKADLRFNKMTKIDSVLSYRIMHGWCLLPGCLTEEGSSANTDFKQTVTNVLETELNKPLQSYDRKRVRCFLPALRVTDWVMFQENLFIRKTRRCARRP